MTPQESHAAAATAATAIRAEVKKSWYKQTSFHLAVGVAITLIAVIIHVMFDFNLFWGLLTGGMVYFVGSKLATQTTSAIKGWGVTLKILGGVVMLVSVLNSGIRIAAENQVTRLDAWLGGSSTATQVQRMGKPVPYDFRTLPIGHEKSEEFGINDSLRFAYGSNPGAPSGGRYFGCMVEVKPNPPIIMKWRYTVERTGLVVYELTDESRALLAQEGFAGIVFRGKMKLVHTPEGGAWPCRDIVQQ
jgi:hypothetical protein